VTRPVRRRWLVGALVATVGLLVGSVSWAVANQGFSDGRAADRGAWAQTRAGGSGGTHGSDGADVPRLSGTVVHVTLGNMGGAMMGGRHGGAGGAMWLRADTATVRAGTVSFVATNLGSVDHELVVLPLVPGQQVGTRPVGEDGTIDETGSLGEASRSDGAGAGDGIQPGASGWVTMNLAPGRYEIVCNVADHYAAGMHTELAVV